VNFSNRPIYQRRRRVALIIVVLLLLLLLLLVVLFLIGRGAGEMGGEQIEQVNDPTVEQTSEVTDGQTTAEEANE
jgi:predicted PurR-regulated permease PerM